MVYLVVARRAGTLILALVLAGCGQPGPTPEVTPTATPTPTPTPTPTASPVVGLLAPFPAGLTATVIHGYNDPLPGEACTIGSTLDHCANQQFALDLEVAGDDMRIVAPVDGTVTTTLARGKDATVGPCLLFTADDGLNINLCHFGTFALAEGTHVTRGCVLGQRDSGWIHLSIDDRRSGKPYPAASLTGDHRLEGIEYPDQGATVRDQYHKGVTTTVTSTNAARKCGVLGDTATPTPAPTASPTPAPTPTPTATPKPTPNAAAVPPPKPGNPAWKVLSVRDSASPKPDGSTIWTNRATWSEPQGVATKFLIYGLTSCPRASAKYNTQPCIVPGVGLSMSDLDLLKEVDGSKRSAKVVWSRPRYAAGPDPYWGFLIRAVNAAGKSRFTILWSQDVCWHCAY